MTTSNFFYLNKIYSIKKQLQVFDILQAIRPTHEERLWLAGFLKYAGYSCDEVIDILHKHCEWSDYDPGITAYQVATVFKQPHRNGNGGKRRARKWDLTFTEVYRIKCARTAEAHRRLQAWARENGVVFHEHEGQFDPTKLGGLEK
jgi:hypothetical protein